MRGYGQKTYKSVTAYINNFSEDTLHFWYTDCYSKYISIEKNPYLHISDDQCTNPNFVKSDIPPHRSQKILLLLHQDKIPDHDIALKISMKIYRWRKAKKTATPDNHYAAEIISDTLRMRYNKDHNEFFTKNDLEKSPLLPEKNFHVLTSKEIASYRLLADQNKITIPKDTTLFDQRKFKTINIPVTLCNNSSDTLRFMSMSCSWDEFYGTNNKNIHIPMIPCDKNIPETIEVLPHEMFSRTIPVIYLQKSVGKNIKFKIYMSVIKYPVNMVQSNPAMFYFGFDSSEYTNFNRIWSNEVAIP